MCQGVCRILNPPGKKRVRAREGRKEMRRERGREMEKMMGMMTLACYFHLVAK